MSTYPPYVIERTSRGERSYDIFSRLLMDRIVFLGSSINDQVANIIVAQLLFLDADDPGAGDLPVHQLARRGSVYAGLAIFDTMNHLRAPVATYCVGMAASMGALLLASGQKGQEERAAQFAHHAAPAVVGLPGHRRRHRDRGKGGAGNP